MSCHSIKWEETYITARLLSPSIPAQKSSLLSTKVFWNEGALKEKFHKGNTDFRGMMGKQYFKGGNAGGLSTYIDIYYMPKVTYIGTF